MVLAETLAQCPKVDFDRPAGETCAPLRASWNEQKGRDCKLQNGVKIPVEEIGWDKLRSILPGCNKVRRFRLHSGHSDVVHILF